MCMCIEFVIQVLKQKNAHLFCCWDGKLKSTAVGGNVPFYSKSHQEKAPQLFLDVSLLTVEVFLLMVHLN